MSNELLFNYETQNAVNGKSNIVFRGDPSLPFHDKRPIISIGQLLLCIHQHFTVPRELPSASEVSLRRFFIAIQSQSIMSPKALYDALQSLLYFFLNSLSLSQLKMSLKYFHNALHSL